MPGEPIEQRVLGALRLVDRVTGVPLLRPMEVSSETASLVRNLRNLYVVTAAQGLEAHTAAFASPPDSPPLGANAYDIAVQDPQQRYLPRRLRLRLPRDPDPDGEDSQDSLFRPLDVAMYPASTADLSPNWSTVRVSVSQGPDPQTAPPVGGCLIRIVDPAAGEVLASGISDQRGEALVIVPGVPVTTFAGEEEEEEDGDGDGPPGGGPPGSGPPGGGPPGSGPSVLATTLMVRLELSLDASAPWPVNPDLLEQDHAANQRLSQDMELATGRMERLTINLS